jgi:hypothetical protein
MLPYLHQHVQTKYVWIDGICIDQYDHVEKSH